MLRCEESSRWFSKPCNFTTEKLIPRGCFQMLGEGSWVYPHNQCDVRSLCSASQLKISTRFSLLPSRLGFVHVDKNGRQKFLVNCMAWGDSWSCCIGLYKSKNGKWLSIFFGEQKYLELSSCNIFGPVASTSQCLLRARGPQRRRGVAGIFHIRSSGAQVTTFGLDYTGQHLRGWGIWSFVYMVVKTIKGFPPPQKKRRKQHTQFKTN